ncbi:MULTISPECIES: hypothetical protein [unclassified Wolbachia]|nr:hypothetical protein [Wolbachia endosymbiont of Culex molestus]CAQ55082.1 hypothetical protein WP0974 [Wolbachia endosymbiont of Culex quinquefasciatus Pel]CQD11305.1 Uncharacterised protein [Wolbachia endosymbiont wPip_Mol of Culex molestus]
MYANNNSTGIEKPPNPLLYDRRNRVSLYFRLHGKQTARNADGSAGKGEWRKRMPFCNEMDRICNINSRENEQTSIWSLVTRNFVNHLREESR